MDVSNPHNQSYWFVLREDQSNVIFSSNNYTLQNPQITGQETRYIVDTGNTGQYMQINNELNTTTDNVSEICENDHLTEKQPRDYFWDRNKVKLLLTMCLDNQFRVTNVAKGTNTAKEKILWNEISAVIGTTPEECSAKYKNLRRIFVRLWKKKKLGKNIKWVHFNICEEVFRDLKIISPATMEPWEDGKVRRLLSLYIENLHRFRNREHLHKDIWKDIAIQLGTTEYNCYHKFKNLKRIYFKLLQRIRQSGQSIKWAYIHYFERIFYNQDPSDTRFWDKTKTKQLLDSYAQIAHKFWNPKFQKKELWKEIAATVGETPSNCDRKFRNLKQTYIKLKTRADANRTKIKWRYYKDFELIYSNLTSCSNDDGAQHLAFKCHEEDYIKQMLVFYLENKEKFRNPLKKKKHLWRQISPKLGLTSEECDRKFRNLKQTYIRLAEKHRETGKCGRWPYYSYFQKIYDEPKPMSDGYNQKIGLDNVTLTEIRRAVRDVQERRDSNEKFERLIKVVEESNNIQRERNRILQALLDRK